MYWWHGFHLFDKTALKNIWVTLSEAWGVLWTDNLIKLLHESHISHCGSVRAAATNYCSKQFISGSSSNLRTLFRVIKIVGLDLSLRLAITTAVVQGAEGENWWFHSGGWRRQGDRASRHRPEGGRGNGTVAVAWRHQRKRLSFRAWNKDLRQTVPALFHFNPSTLDTSLLTLNWCLWTPFEVSSIRTQTEASLQVEVASDVYLNASLLGAVLDAINSILLPSRFKKKKKVYGMKSSQSSEWKVHDQILLFYNYITWSVWSEVKIFFFLRIKSHVWDHFIPNISLTHNILVH